MKIAVYEARKDELEILDYFRDLFEIDVIVTSDKLTKDTVSFAEGCDGVSTLGQSQLNKELLDLLYKENIMYISTRTIGFNHIDVDYAKSLGMKVCNACYEPNGVAEYTVMLMLMVLRRYKPALWRGQVYDYSLDGLEGRQLNHMTVGIMGTGRIGATVVKILQGFGCKVLAYDIRQNPSLKGMCEYVDLDQLYKDSDIISLHMPLFTSNYHIINKRAISEMKDGVIIINCSRGELLNLDVCIDALESGKIGALGLDTVETEEGLIHQDLRNDILTNRSIAYVRQFPNVVMTQHMAFYTKEAVESMVKCGLEGICEMRYNGTYPTML